MKDTNFCVTCKYYLSPVRIGATYPKCLHKHSAHPVDYVTGYALPKECADARRNACMKASEDKTAFSISSCPLWEEKTSWFDYFRRGKR